MQFHSEKPIILASGSPRRKELFSMLGVPFDVVTSNVIEHEQGLLTESFIDYAQDIAVRKGQAVAKDHPHAVVISADTVVGYGKRVFPKPENNEEAKMFLKMLSGRTHSVVTAVAIFVDGVQNVFSNVTKVTFFDYDETLVDAYVATGDSLDKAGGYGIQSEGALLVEKIDGDYYSVMGLPIAKLTRQLLSQRILSVKGGA